MKNNNNEYFDIVKKFILETVRIKKLNPFHFHDKEDLMDCELDYFLSKKEKQRIKLQYKKRQEEIKKYHNYIHWYVKNNNLDKTKFLNEIEYFRFYTYAIIWNTILNDSSMKKKDDSYISEHNPNYVKNIVKIISKYKFIDYEELITNEYPVYHRNAYKYLQDRKGNYILPRIDTQFNINSYYNLSNFLLKIKI